MKKIFKILLIPVFVPIMAIILGVMYVFAYSIFIFLIKFIFTPIGIFLIILLLSKYYKNNDRYFDDEDDEDDYS